MTNENAQFNIQPDKNENAKAELDALKVEENKKSSKKSATKDTSTKSEEQPSISFKQNQKSRSNFDYIHPDEEMLDKKLKEEE